MVPWMSSLPPARSCVLVLAMVAAGVLSDRRACADEGFDPFAVQPATLSVRGTVADSAMGSTIGGNLSYLRAAYGLEGELGLTRLSTGGAMDIALLGRLGHVGRAHVLTLGLGPRFIISSAYGSVTMAQSELAYEYRPVGALGVLLGVGPFKVFGSPHVTPCDGPAACPGLAEFGLRFRLSVGFTF
jgi:hypothetical protein